MAGSNLWASYGGLVCCPNPTAIRCVLPCVLQVAALVFYILCETINKNQFVLNFVVCIVLLAMDFWTVSVGPPTMAKVSQCSCSWCGLTTA